MFTDYWWILAIIIILVMICYPTNKQNNTYKKKYNNVSSFNTKPILTNLSTIASYYVGIN
jgi:hypothetical protein